MNNFLSFSLQQPKRNNQPALHHTNLFDLQFLMSMTAKTKRERQEDCLSSIQDEGNTYSKKTLVECEQKVLPDQFDYFSVECVDNVGPYDVLCGRQREAFRNVGNRRFRVTVSLSLDKYLKAPTRYCKSNVIGAVVDQVKGTGGRFLKWWSNEWVEIDDKQAREKVGHALRDMALARENNLMRKKRCTGSVERFVRHPSFFYPCRESKANSISSEKFFDGVSVTTIQALREVGDDSSNNFDVPGLEDVQARGERQEPSDIPLDLVDELMSWDDLQHLLES